MYCVPATSVPVERIFSHGGIFMRPNRARMTDDDVSRDFSSNRHHRSNGDCLEGKRENYQVCSVQYCVQQLYTVRCTHIRTDLTVLWIEFCLTGPISLCLDSFFCVCIILCLTVYCMHVSMCTVCSIGTW